MKSADELGDEAARWFERADDAIGNGDLAEALAASRRAASGFARAGGEAHPDHANARVQLGRILGLRGDARGALAHLTYATESLAKVRGGGRPVAEMHAYANLVLAFTLMGLARYDEARTAAERALKLAKKLGARHFLVADAHNQLGMIGKYSASFDDAAAHYKAALPLVRALHGATSLPMATLYHNLGGLEHSRGRPRRGEPPARRAVEIARKLLPAGHPELLAHEVAHAALLDGLGRGRETLPIYKRALAAYRRRFGPVHYEVASTLHNLAAVEHDLGQLAAAERHYDEAIACYRKLFGPGHPDEALSLHNLGQLLKDRGRLADARRAHRKANAIFRRRLGADHPHTKASAEALDSLQSGG